ncbi:MAG: hypothetical protein K2H38_07395 [Muribaculaceae bacterium]|nr:hypothetical protein [Muribaculaceae bacterium]
MKATNFILGAMILLSTAFTSCGKSAQKEDNADSITADTITIEKAASSTQQDEIQPDGATSDELAAGSIKYVPASEGDCYIGERTRVNNDSGIWCEITFYPNGTCELKMENSSLKGTFSGEVKGKEYNIAVKFSNGEEYDFVGDKSKLVADDGLVKYIVELEM